MTTPSPSHFVRALSLADLQEVAAYTVQVLASLGQPSLEATKEFLAERETADSEEGLTDDLVALVEAKIAAAIK